MKYRRLARFATIPNKRSVFIFSSRCIIVLFQLITNHHKLSHGFVIEMMTASFWNMLPVLGDQIGVLGWRTQVAYRVEHFFQRRIFYVYVSFWCWTIKDANEFKLWYFIQAAVAEWLRRLTRNQLCSARTGSNPVGSEYFFKKKRKIFKKKIRFWRLAGSPLAGLHKLALQNLGLQCTFQKQRRRPRNKFHEIHASLFVISVHASLTRQYWYTTLVHAYM